MEFPQFQTHRLILNQISEEDTEAVFNIFSDSDVVKYYDLSAFTELEQATKLIRFFNTRYQESHGIRWAIRLKATNELIGTCGFNSWNIKMKNAVIGYDLHPKFWGKGISTEAIHAIVSSAFEGTLTCGVINRIQADTVLGNVASESLLLKIGFKEEGIRRQSGFWKDKFHDLKCFGLIKSEYCA